MAAPSAARDPILFINITQAKLVRIFDALKGSQDLFVQLVVLYDDGSEKVVGRTDSCKNGNLNPVWNEKFRTTRGRGRSLKFRVFADHLWRNPTLCGEASLDLDALWQRALSGSQAPMSVGLVKSRGNSDEQTGVLNLALELEELGGGASAHPSAPQLARRASPDQPVGSGPTAVGATAAGAAGGYLGGNLAPGGGALNGAQGGYGGPKGVRPLLGGPAAQHAQAHQPRPRPMAAAPSPQQQAAQPQPQPQPQAHNRPAAGQLELGPSPQQVTQLQQQAAQPQPQAHVRPNMGQPELGPSPQQLAQLQQPAQARPAAGGNQDVLGPLPTPAPRPAGPPTAAQGTAYATGASGQWWNSFIDRG